MKILFLGGDARQGYASEDLRRRGTDAEVYTDFILDSDMCDKISHASVIVFPLPCVREGSYINMPSGAKIGLLDVVRHSGSGCLILGGKIPHDMRAEIRRLGRECIDYYDIESFQIRNALLSAEGAIYYAHSDYKSSLYGARIGIFGFGRIGKMLAYLLRSSGARICIFARREADISWSRVLGMEAAFIGGEKYLTLAGEQDIIFNTVPYNIITKDLISALKRDVMLIDLASAPFGISEELLGKHCLNYRRELGIPARYAPQSAGEILSQVVLSIISGED